jgi:NADH-quinone oxidoreductase subunit L
MSSAIPNLLILIPALPLAAAIVTAVFGRKLRGQSHWPVTVAIIGSFMASCLLLASVVQESRASSMPVGWETTVDVWHWMRVDSAISTPEAAHAAADPGSDGTLPDVLPATLPLTIDVTLRADALTAIMLSMVTFIASLVAIYSIGYMRGDRGYWRFYSYIGLFVFSMAMLVSSSNFVLLYVFWEAVGLCSYLLVGFWYEKPAAAAAGKKAFLVNRVGDFGFALGLFLIWTTYGTLDFHDAHGVAGIFGQTRLAHPDWYVGGGIATAICLLLMLGACGKSAQFPLHVWLPDAMEGPTPVSALIHAATMVTAGVYMVTRCTPLFMVSPDAQHVVAVIGFITAALGAVIAMTQTDLKRVLAYSTISQLGYMFLGLGVATVGGITAGMFHLFTHAFFKGLLFLGAGSVMHAMGGVLDMRQIGGLRRRMPITHGTFLFGCLALAGVVPFAGFWSKDAIISAVHHRGDSGDLANVFNGLYWGALFIAFLTSVYTFRAFFLTFYGPERVPHEAGHHAHESPPTMTGPLVILAICSLVVGAYFEWTEGFARFIAYTPSLAYRAETLHGAEGAAGFNLAEAAIGTLVALSGLALAAILYLGNPAWVAALKRLLLPLYWLSAGKLFFDPIYNVLFVGPLRLLASFSYWFDRVVIDALVNFVGRIPPTLAEGLRSLQTGMVQFYALAMLWGVVVLIVTLSIWPALAAVWQ